MARVGSACPIRLGLSIGAHRVLLFSDTHRTATAGVWWAGGNECFQSRKSATSHRPPLAPHLQCISAIVWWPFNLLTINYAKLPQLRFFPHIAGATDSHPTLFRSLPGTKMLIQIPEFLSWTFLWRVNQTSRPIWLKCYSPPGSEKWGQRRTQARRWESGELLHAVHFT